MNESTPLPCPSCGETLPSEAPQGLCPRCLLNGLIEGESSPPGEGSLEEVRAKFPDWEIHELIGVGGFGRVYKARDPRVDRVVALKILAPDRVGDPEWVERFTREARALARLNHPHIVQVHGFGTSPEPHLVMEFVDGVNLRQAMQSGGLTTREALVIVPKLCDALHYAHEHDVLHRDIKPENILIDTEGRVKVVDFGLAKLRGEPAAAFTLTQSGAKLGTLAYMAPEQIEKPAEVDHRADLYSLGVVFYEMLTGELPLGRFPSPSEANGTDPRLDAVVLRTLEKKRENRFPDAEAMRSGIETAASTPLFPSRTNWNDLNFEYRSRTHLKGWPLLHVAFGKDEKTGNSKRARGIVAVGNHATGGLALGIIARGIVAWGVVSLGLLSSGVLSVGIFSLGVLGIALFGGAGIMILAPYAFGVMPCGYLAAGVMAFGVHAADLNGPIDSLAAEVGDRWYPSLMALQSWANAIGLSVMMLLAAFAAQKTSNRRLVAMYLGLSLMGPISFLSSRATRPPSFIALQDQHERVAEEEKAALVKKAGTERYLESIALYTQWTREASRTDSSEAKEKGISQILEGIRDQDVVRIDAGLMAARAIAEIHADKTALRDAIRDQLDHEDTQIRGNAILALLETPYESSDITRILNKVDQATDDDLYELGVALNRFSKQDFTGEFAAPMLMLLRKGFAASLRHEKESVFQSRGLLGSVWGAKVTPEIESLLVQWSRLDDPDGRSLNIRGRGNDALYYALSTLGIKSTAAIDRLLELAENPDGNIAGRALMGLGNAKPGPEDRKRIASGIIRVLENRNENYPWFQGMNTLQQFASANHLPALKSLAARKDLPAERREKLESLITHLSQ